MKEKKKKYRQAAIFITETDVFVGVIWKEEDLCHHFVYFMQDNTMVCPVCFTEYKEGWEITSLGEAFMEELQFWVHV